MGIQELAAQYSGAWARRDLDAIMALHTEDTLFHLHASGEGPAEGADAVREAFETVLTQTADLRFDTRRAYLGADHFVSEYVISGMVGDKQVVCDGIDVIAVRDGHVARKDSYLDSAAFAERLGSEAGVAGGAS